MYSGRYDHTKEADSQILLSMADLKGQWEKKCKDLHSFCQNTERDIEERYCERYYRNGSSHGPARLK
jgi:hypothetical protein